MVERWLASGTEADRVECLIAIGCTKGTPTSSMAAQPRISPPAPTRRSSMYVAIFPLIFHQTFLFKLKLNIAVPNPPPSFLFIISWCKNIIKLSKSFEFLTRKVGIEFLVGKCRLRRRVVVEQRHVMTSIRAANVCLCKEGPRDATTIDGSGSFQLVFSVRRNT